MTVTVEDIEWSARNAQPGGIYGADLVGCGDHDCTGHAPVDADELGPEVDR